MPTEAQIENGRKLLIAVADDISRNRLLGEAATMDADAKIKALNWAAYFAQLALQAGDDPELLARIDHALMTLGGISFPTLIKTAVDAMTGNPVAAPDALTDEDADAEPELNLGLDDEATAPVAPPAVPQPPKAGKQQRVRTPGNQGAPATAPAAPATTTAPAAAASTTAKAAAPRRL
jgi:hypothetical protein